MFLPIRRLALFSLALLLGSSTTVLAQNAPAANPLPTHTLRTINPADTDYSDLDFLRQEIGGARVVMLGEPTHGVGTATEARIRLLRFLKERMGFTTVAFESGFYALDLAEREIQRGAPVPAAISASVYPVWTETQEFQAMLPLLGKGGLRVTGFDSQVSWNDDEMLEELETFLKTEKGADGIAYDYLDECVSTMAEHSIFPPSHQILLFDMQLNKARKLLTKVAAGPDKQRRERAALWLQQLRSLQAQAHDYATNDPAVKDSAEFKAKDSNARDAQMADNLLWYLRQHPQEKVVCWGAIGHLASKVSGLENEELHQFKPMGQTMKAALGADAVYVLSTLAGGGAHGFGYWGKHQTVPVPAPGSLEADLLAQGQEYSFISLKHDAPGHRLTTYGFEFLPISGPWSEAIDGLLYLKTIKPPSAATAIAAALQPATAEVATSLPPTKLGQQNAALRRPTKTGAALALSGTVLDRKTGQPVPFATVAVPARSAGTITDAQGRFQLEARRGELLQVSSIGYEAATLPVQSGVALSVRLLPATLALADVRVSAQSQDPNRIMKKVIKAAATNYQRQDFTNLVYTRRRLTNFDTLRHEVEYVSQTFEPAGLQDWSGGFLMMGAKEMHKVLEKHVVVATAKPASYKDYEQGGHGFYTAGSDPVRISPLFKTGTLGRYVLKLDSLEQRNGETLYVIRFKAKRANKRTTGMGLTAGYSGKVYVRQNDFAVVRYEGLWQEDTVEYNAVARKYYGTQNTISRHYSQVFSDDRKVHVVTYQKAADGRYHVATSVAQNVAAGRVLGGKAFYSQASCEEYFSAWPGAVAPLDPKTEPALNNGEIWQLLEAPYRPEFWQTYQRPVPAEPAPELEAGK